LQAEADALKRLQAESRQGLPPNVDALLPAIHQSSPISTRQAAAPRFWQLAKILPNFLKSGPACVRLPSSRRFAETSRRGKKLKLKIRAIRVICG
jgi:hypothetical protein